MREAHGLDEPHQWFKLDERKESKNSGVDYSVIITWVCPCGVTQQSMHQYPSQLPRSQ